MKVTNYFAAYTKTASGRLKPTLPGPWTGQSGVYFIKPTGATRPVYVGSSANNLKKTIYRHFQQWSSDREQRYERTVYNKTGYLIKVIFCSAEQAINLEMYFIKRIQPRDNPIKYNQLILSLKDQQKAREQVREADQIEIQPEEKVPF